MEMLGRAAGGGSGMDMEKVFLRLHEKLIHRVTRRFSLPFLRLSEYVALANAVLALALLVYLHSTFVGVGQSLSTGNASAPEFPNCVVSDLYDQLAAYRESPVLGNGADADLVQIQVGGIWSKLASVDQKGAEALKVAKMHGQQGHVGSELFQVWLSDPLFLYSRERGFLMLKDSLRAKHGITRLNVSLSFDCLGASSVWLTFLLDNFVGYQTVVENTLIHATGGRGFMYSMLSRDLVDLEYASSGSRRSPGDAGDKDSSALAALLAFKLGIVVTTFFLLFITSTLVHHTLRETQGMMLQFTFELQSHIEASRPTGHLIWNHVINSLVFVPIMVGMLFFLFEFYNDQLLAFMLLAIAWICELFSVITLRTATAIKVFPRLFLLYSSAFHFYFFSFPSGFSYLALMTSIIFLHHAMLCFWNRFEIPAFRDGQISAALPRQISMVFRRGEAGKGGQGGDTPRPELPPSLACHAFFGQSHSYVENVPSVAECTLGGGTGSGPADLSTCLDKPSPGGTTTPSSKSKGLPIDKRNRSASAPKDDSLPPISLRADLPSSSPASPTNANVNDTSGFFIGDENEEEPLSEMLEPTMRRKKRVTLHNSPGLDLSSAEMRRRYVLGGSEVSEALNTGHKSRFEPGGF